MAGKEQLSLNIKKWLQLDKEMKMLQKELKERKQKKNEVTDSLVEIMKQNEIDCVDISDGKILYTQSNIKSPINKKHLLDSLDKYFADNESVPTEEIVKFILENRTINLKESIRLKSNLLGKATF
jgi:hypothetical protein